MNGFSICLIGLYPFNSSPSNVFHYMSPFDSPLQNQYAKT